ncbi:MAG: helix-turn-helix transcriptional regulator [Clostridia bacterium]|nr:helix-turn-helix transcriptional regulator [Clostridia bacterium]
MTKLRRVLREKGYTGKTFAEACGVGRSIIYKYMCGNRPVSRKIAERFAAILKVAPEELMEEC